MSVLILPPCRLDINIVLVATLCLAVVTRGPPASPIRVLIYYGLSLSNSVDGWRTVTGNRNVRKRNESAVDKLLPLSYKINCKISSRE